MSAQPIIELTNADIFQRENLVLAGINTTINEGEFVYIVGRVGSGKSSLIKTLNAELPLQNGKGVVAGFVLHQLKTKELALLRRKLGVVFQDFRLLIDRTVFKNLEFVLKSTGWKQDKIIKERIQEVLESVGMELYAHKMPHELSGGEQQRIVIARAILNHPLIILADEPTGNLDPETSEEILNLLKGLNQKGITIVMASHDYILIGKHRARTLICENAGIKDTAMFDGSVDFESLLE
ncbi:MAG: ATP-binding cassette domain-containing protein [Mariniphaga sp.]|nr:ATP-binding cassette domain-containing protein [Mariniphaga sp.]